MGQDAAQRPLPVRVGQEVQAVPRRLSDSTATRPMRDFTDDLAALRQRLDEAVGLPAHRRAAAQPAPARDRGVAARPVGRPRPGPQGQRRAGSASPRTSSCSTRSAARSTTPRRSSSWPGRRATSRSSPRSPRPSPSLRRHLRRARAAVAVHRRVRRGRRHLRDPVRRGRGRRPGLGRDAAAHVPALGRAPGLRRRARRGVARQRGRHLVGHLPGQRAPRLRPAALRARRAPAGAHVAVQRPGQAPDRLRRAEGHALPRGRARHRDRREGPAHRHLPLVGRRRPARQRDRLGGAHHPPADRASWCRARTSAASTRTRTGPCRSSR